eukprot:10304706-Alexandrium_andersonii.AAC.1
MGGRGGDIRISAAMSNPLGGSASRGQTRFRCDPPLHGWAHRPLVCCPCNRSRVRQLGRRGSRQALSAFAPVAGYPPCPHPVAHMWGSLALPRKQGHPNVSESRAS